MIHECSEMNGKLLLVLKPSLWQKRRLIVLPAFLGNIKIIMIQYYNYDYSAYKTKTKLISSDLVT